MTRWTAADIPDQTGRRAVVTGATSGLGRWTALELVRAGADVVLAVRDEERGAATAEEILRGTSGSPHQGTVEVRALDLADLGSVSRFADSLGADGARLDLLVNNAGVMAIPRRETVDGFEMQLGTNHLGHAALTLRLLPVLARTGAAGGTVRVVTVSSGVHRMGRIDLDDLMGERSYAPWRAYAQSKLANLLFAYELQRRLDMRGAPVASYAAHPGYAATGLQSVGPRMRGSRLGERASELGNRLLAQPADRGALPTLYAATVPGLPPGSYVGPDGPFEQRGWPTVVGSSARSRDEAMAARLFDVTEDLVGVRLADLDLS